MKDKYLALLHSIAPLSKKSQQQVWKNIQADLEIDVPSKVRKKVREIVKLWHAVVLVFLSAIFIPFAPSATTILDAQSTGWDATLQGSELEIKAVNPMIVGKSQVCVLWVKNGNHITKLTQLPDGGIKNINLDQSTLDKLSMGGTVMISIEERDMITLPNKIEYQRQL